jgi:ankyrin repeat protein
LHFAASSNLEIVQYLYSIGVNWINEKNSFGRTPIFNASQKVNFDIVEYLISKGADYKLLDNKNNSIIAVAPPGNRRKLSQYLKKLDFSIVYNEIADIEPNPQLYKESESYSYYSSSDSYYDYSEDSYY